MTSPIADFVVALKDGSVVSQGSLSRALEQDAALSTASAQEAELLLASSNKEVDIVTAKDDGRLVLDEEISEGRVGWSAGECHIPDVGSSITSVLWK